jgi:signal peptidase I
MGKAKRLRESRSPKPGVATKAERPSLKDRSRAYILAWLPFIAIVLFTRQALAEAYRIPSGSMEPTLLVGDWLFVNKLRYGPHIPFTNKNLPGYANPKRGDVAVFVSPPQDPSIRISPDEITPMLVKRIVGMPGDTVQMHDGRRIIVPPGTYFMMGDNRDNSIDSRWYGPVPRANLRGTPMFVYYSYDPEDDVPWLRAVTAIRWKRLGTWIR